MTAPEAPAGQPATSDPTVNPWERWSWVIQTVWLVFLVFPVLAVVGEPRPLWQVVLGLALIVTFGLVYALGAQHLQRLERACRPWAGRGVAYLAVLVGCTVGTATLIGAGSLGFLPFVVSFGMFALPIVWSMVVGVLCVAVAGLTALFIDREEGSWVVAIIVFAVGAMTAAIRLMTDRGAQYEAMSRELALVAERERVARDVHDVLGHSLTVVTVKAELAERLVDLDPERAKGELAEIQALSRQALAEIRETVGGLRQARLDNELVSARTALAGAGIEAHVPEDPTAVDPRHRTVLAWVLREATTNVVRHSDADACWVELDTDRLALEAGASGFVVKDTPARQLAEAVRRVHAGLRVVDPSLATESLVDGANPLTERERDVLQVALRGGTVAAIAEVVHLSSGTVRNHLSSAIGKTGTSTRAEAARVAQERGWL